MTSPNGQHTTDQPTGDRPAPLDVDETVFVARLQPAAWTLDIPELGITVVIDNHDDAVSIAEDIIGKHYGVPSGRVQVDPRFDPNR